MKKNNYEWIKKEVEARYNANGTIPNGFENSASMYKHAILIDIYEEMAEEMTSQLEKDFERVAKEYAIYESWN